MESQAWLESSLRRSAILGQEVLDRATRRSVDWASNSNPSQTPTAEDGHQSEVPYPCLDDAFKTVVEFMSQTTHKCKNFYMSNPSPALSDKEKSHVSRFHSNQSLTTRPTVQTRKLSLLSDEDFHIEVPPGSYAITAATADSRQQTRLVSVKAGESVNLTFVL